ncbi:hypothetical protein HYV82_01290 [Candidatus Woesearchaeota archaeon]|nr:hypothetical protein [Candidatus Woesearchaeota archaeon]
MRVLGFKRGVWLPVIVALFVFLASISLASADSSFTVEVKPVIDTVLSGEQAIYELIITNGQLQDDTFRIRAPEIFWSVQSKPLYHYFGGVDIKRKSSQTVTLLINPIKPLPAGQYMVELDIESLNTEIVDKKYVAINIKPSTVAFREYSAAVTKKVDMPQKIDPRQKITATIELTNKNPKNIDRLLITAESSLLKAGITTSLAPLEKKTVSQEFAISPITPPQKGTLTWRFSFDNSTLEPDINQGFEIIGYSELKEEKLPSQSSFLKTVEETRYFNDGNTVAYKTMEKRTNILRRLFTGTEPKAAVVSRPEGSYLMWDLAVKPQQTETVRIVESYRSLFALFVVSVLLAVLYYVFRSPVAIRKEAAVISLEEEGISDMKVVLHVRNRGSKGYDRLIIADKVPVIASIEKETGLGTLKPAKVTGTKHGTIIKWELEHLERHEERVLSYRIKSKLSILGTFSLPACRAKFYDEGKERKTSSNAVRVKI